MKSLDRLIKALEEHDLDWKIQNIVYDKGHDAVGIYEYIMEYEITPVIALNERNGVYPSPTGTAEKVDENGIPICACGKKMRRNHYDKKKGRIYYTCPVKRPTHKDGKYCMVTHTDECPRGVLCQPDTKMGPVVYVRTKDDPRLYPPKAREK